VQIMFTMVADSTYELTMPPADAMVMPDIRWGAFDTLFTAAYWCGQAWQAALHGHFRALRLGRSLAEETAACLLGGYGMKAELGLAAYRRLRDRATLVEATTAAEFERHLSEPFLVDGRATRYRFPRQKAVYLTGCLAGLGDIDEAASSDLELRDALTRLPGIGLKTASWIVRNYRTSNDVAVLDVHVLRAGQILGLFGPHETPQRHYRGLEDRFIRFAAAVEAPASLLDALVWQHMRLLRQA
jgi:thermostable 8-oxoguanine DNA glycosylase